MIPLDARDMEQATQSKWRRRQEYDCVASLILRTRTTVTSSDTGIPVGRWKRHQFLYVSKRGVGNQTEEFPIPEYPEEFGHDRQQQ